MRSTTPGKIVLSRVDAESAYRAIRPEATDKEVRDAGNTDMEECIARHIGLLLKVRIAG